MVATDPVASRSSSIKSTLTGINASNATASKPARALPWSTATIVGWAALAVATIVTIVIVVVAITLP